MGKEDVIMSIGADTTNIEKSLMGLQKKTRNVAGNIAMQFQDIAVSLQGGMSGLQVMGQQGSQLLSIFGPGGMIAGGVLAIGGAFAYWGKTVKEGFDTAISKSYELTNAIGANINFSSLSQASDYVAKIKEQMIEVNKEYEQGGFFKSAGNLIGGMASLPFGGLSHNEKISAQIKAQGELYWKNVRAEQRAVELSGEALGDEEKRLAILREGAESSKEELDRLSVKRKLTQEISDIERSSFARTTKNQMIADAEVKAKLRNEEIDIAIMRKEEAAFKKKADDELRAQLRLEDATQDVRQMEMKRAGVQKSIIDAAREEFEYRKKIEEALLKGEKALAAQITKQQQLSRLARKEEEYLKSPMQKKAERDEARQREKAARVIASRERAKAQAAANAGFGGRVEKKEGGAKGVPNLQPNAPAAGAAGAAAGNAMKVDTLVVKVLKHG